MIVKKNDGIKESTDSSTTIEDDQDTRGTYSQGNKLFNLSSLKQILLCISEFRSALRSPFVLVT